MQFIKWFFIISLSTIVLNESSKLMFGSNCKLEKNSRVKKIRIDEKVKFFSPETRSQRRCATSSRSIILATVFFGSPECACRKAKLDDTRVVWRCSRYPRVFCTDGVWVLICRMISFLFQLFFSNTIKFSRNSDTLCTRTKKLHAKKRSSNTFDASHTTR